MKQTRILADLQESMSFDCTAHSVHSVITIERGREREREGDGERERGRERETEKETERGCILLRELF